MGNPKLFASHTDGKDTHKKKHCEALLRNPMEVWRLKFVDVIHEEFIGKVAINMEMQLVPVWVHKALPQTEQAGNAQCLYGVKIAANNGVHKINRDQYKAQHEPAVQVDPQEH